MAAEWGGRERALALASAVALALLGLLGKAAQLQVFQGGHYRRLSIQNRVKMIAIPSPRGRMLDRNGVVIAESRPGYALVLTGTGSWRPAVDRAARLLGLDSLALQSAVRQQRSQYPKDPVKLARDLSPEKVALIEENMAELPGLRLEYEALRHANFGPLGSHLLGYVSEIGRRELESRREQGYRFGDAIGKAGLERQYEVLLRGADGCEYVEVDAHGTVQGGIPQMPELPPAPGADITLTVDWRLQLFMEGLFAPGQTGSAVALEPGTGRILALVSRPNFDPNLFAGGVGGDDWEKLSKDPSFPLWDRAIRSLYPPGSTFKAVTALAALSESLITPDTRMRQSCQGGMRIGNRHYKCWKKGGHGSLDMRQAIVQSCDVYFYQLGMMLGVDRLNRWSKELGLTRPTGIDLPQEVDGLVPTTSWYEKRLGRGAVTAGIPANLAIGQGEVLATPLQMASLFAALGKRGLAARPHLMLKATGPDGRPLSEERPDTVRLAVSREHLQAVVEALAAVVNQPGGTGGAARMEGVTVAGKTGTSQNPHGEDHSWFVGFAPAEDPVIAVAAVVENAGHGSAVAAPLVGRTIRAYLSMLNDEGPRPVAAAGP